MNKRLAQFIPFGSRRQPWHERYFNGKGASWMWPVVGLGLGAGLMYVLDPDRGKRRRAVARDKVTGVVHKTGAAIGKKSRDLKNRARGMVAETGTLFRRNEAAEQAELR